MITGILPVDKPLGWTSHDVVARVRRLTGQKQVGHAGTLDPLATGVLALVLGDATRLSSYLMNTSKVYCAEIVLGVSTTTDDGEARPRGYPTTVTQGIPDVSDITAESIQGGLAQFVGTFDQIPPNYAAIRQGGQKLYVLARQGAEIEAQPRRVTIHQVEVTAWQPPRLRLRVQCAAGAYIRALARDLGAALGVGAYLHALRRERSGNLTTTDCVILDQLTDANAVLRYLLPSDYALLDQPALVLSDQECGRITTGLGIRVPQSGEGTIRLYDASGTLVAIGMMADGGITPYRVFSGGRGGHARRR